MGMTFYLPTKTLKETRMLRLEQFAEWLPWYVNGTLNASDRAVMDSYLAETPMARDEVRYYERMSETMKRRADTVSADIGLAETLQRIKTSPKGVAAPAATSRATAATPDDEGQNWLQRLLGGGWMKPAFACAMAIVVAQSVLLIQQHEEAIIYRSKGTATEGKTSAGAPLEGTFLRVVFKANATEGELRLLLASTQAWVAGGPGQAGEYYVRFAPDHVQAALETLKASGLVSEVAPVNRVPVAQ
jgi:hypothetical protein